ncbi:NADP-dependent phosphogluconate dehydrogenase [Rhodophyticola porphyridii]|uniref:6-phosphogluconate dehydrogenase, decarboxylating n=1 Tax=Rhodophyticola porphyridii TaxID=1852017 RepID=A0A3L9XVU9_9RHOB|nr:NADP-dependent phosphogluconate dehydrogenase [Rhodophyticola porphyridii]RMA40649.1 NADP-dependent phosphogluconate dehydrogenase [Rhodophyticola porphyridii]
MAEQAEIGLIGLGTMGRNLALNIAEKGHPLAVFNRTVARTEEFMGEAGALARRITPAETLEDFVVALQSPRRIILLVPAGQPVDDQIEALKPLLDAGDLIIDGGNSDWRDTNRRVADAAPILHMGLGVSGGAKGAREGPSMMAGGPDAAYAMVAPVLESIAADFDGVPCVAHLGPGGAGHYIKMVHNGIEYADMQMIAEVYGLLRDGLGMAAHEMAPIFARWNEGVLQSYLIEITAKIAATADPDTGQPMLDVIADRAGQKGTGRWTVMDAQERGAPLPAVEAAVMARVLSSRYEDRASAEALFGAGPTSLPRDALTETMMEGALIAGKVLAYAQGFELMAAASDGEDWAIPLPRVAEIWRAGCIIRSAMLDDMASALAEASDRALIMAPHFAGLLARHHGALRQTVSLATAHGIAVPALSSALNFFDMMRTVRGTANMLQAQRDFFGQHGFERLDRPDESGLHGPWAG